MINNPSLNTNFALKAAFAGVLLSAASTQVAAGPVVPPLFGAFQYNTASGFTSFGPAVGVTGSDETTFFSGTTGQGNDGAGADEEVWQTLAWGDQAVKSSIGASDFGLGNILVNGPAVDTGSVFHNNRPITGIYLDSATLLAEIVLGLDLSDPTPPGTLGLNSITFEIDFFETENNKTKVGKSCEDGGVVGTGVNVAGCADIFVLTSAGGGFNDSGEIVRNLPLPDPNYFYNAILTIEGAGQLSTSACEAATAGPDQVSECFGIITQEEKNNILGVSLRIEAIAVPVPGTLALFSSVLLASGLIARRRKR